MRKLILRMNLTLDGVAAREDNAPIDGVDLGDPDSWRTIFATLETVDAMLIGAGAHREYLNYWQSVLTNPEADPNERRRPAKRTSSTNTISKHIRLSQAVARNSLNTFPQNNVYDI